MITITFAGVLATGLEKDAGVTASCRTPLRLPLPIRLRQF